MRTFERRRVGVRKTKLTTQKPSSQPSASKKRKGKEPRPNYLTMDSVEYARVRHKDWYTQNDRDTDIVDSRFWCLEQQFIYEDIYLRFKHPLRLMLPIKLTALSDKPSHAQAAHVIEQFGLVPLMETQCDFSPQLIMQFFSTLVIRESSVAKEMKWMSGTIYCESTFKKFGAVLGYKYREDPAVGHRMHDFERTNKNIVMKKMYAPKGIIGEKKGLLPLYDQLVTTLRFNIAPSGGNNDAITSPLVNLLCLAEKCINNRNPTAAFNVDVMDFIYHEILEAIKMKTTIPYGPYIMLLIKDTLQGQLPPTDDMVSHYFKKVYKTKAATAPTRPSGSFMRDARSSGSQRFAPAAAPVFKPKSRPLNWFQRHVLCMNVDIRHGQYEAYCERQNILKRFPTLPNDPLVSDPLSYEKWNEQSHTP